MSDPIDTLTAKLKEAEQRAKAAESQVAELRSLKAGIVKVEIASRLFGSELYVPE